MRVGALRQQPLLLEVTAHCRAEAPSEFAAEPGVSAYLSSIESNTGHPLAIDGDTLRLPRGADGIRYRVDLGLMALERDDFEVALEVGRSTLAPGYSWLLSPVGIRPETRVRVEWLGGPAGAGFTTGLTPSLGGYELRANEIPVATFGVFGEFGRAELNLKAHSARPASIELVTLDGPLAARPPLVARWVLETAQAVADFFGGFPVERALLVVVPIENRRQVLHGKVLPESSPGIALLVGSQAEAPQLYADWILTHELFHLGFPSFIDEGKWLDEGLATYFEPVIRARQGWLSEHDVWQEFFRNMPRGRGVLENEGLTSPKSQRGLYWAGASLCLMADVAARSAGDPNRGLEHAVRAVLGEGGDATRVWRLADTTRVIDRELGAPVLEPLARRYAQPGQPAPLARLFQDLGVEQRGDAVVLSETSRLAHIRRAITWGARPK